MRWKSEKEFDMWRCWLMMGFVLCLSLNAVGQTRDVPSNNVKDFGAVGDGQVDDTAALQKALDLGRVIELPPGVYRITKAVRLKAGSGLIGTRDSTISVAGDINGLNAENVQDIWLKDFSMTRRSGDSIAGGRELIDIKDSHDVTIESLIIKDSTSFSRAIWVRGGYADSSPNTLAYNIRISNCLIEDYQRDGDKGGNDGEGIHGAGITLSFCKNFVVSGNRIIQHEPSLQTNREEIKGPYAGLKQNYQSTALEIISCLYGTVTGNLIDTSGQGIDLGGGRCYPGQTTETGMRGSQHVTVTGNTIHNCYSTGIKLVNGASYNTISANTVLESGLVGIWLVPGATAHQDLTVVQGNVVMGNTVVNTGWGMGREEWFREGGRRPAGITIEAARQRKNRPTGNVIIGNVVSNDPDHPTMNYGISDMGVGREHEEYFGYGNTFAANVSNGALIKNISVQTAINRLLDNPVQSQQEGDTKDEEQSSDFYR